MQKKGNNFKKCFCTDDEDDDDEFFTNTKLHGCLSNEEEDTTLWLRYVHECPVPTISLIIQLYLQKCKKKKRFSSILHAKVMLVLPAWQDAPGSSLNTLCLKTTTTSWQSEGWRTTISCSFFCFVFVVVSLHKTTTKTAKSSIHTQPRPNTVPNSCWTSICNLHPRATWSRSLFTFSKDYNTNCY